MGEKRVIKDGHFGVIIERPGELKEERGHPDGTSRKLEIIDGNIVLTNNYTGKTEIFPPGTKVTTHE